MSYNSEKKKQLQLEIKKLKEQLYLKEKELFDLENVCEPKEIEITNHDITRYVRQMIVPNLGMKGQLKLKRASVLIVGAGGLGCPAALYLAGAGVGHIGIIDYDILEENNLHRQVLHGEEYIGQSKVESASKSLKRLNSRLKVTPIEKQINSANALDIIKGFNVVIDATDNIATRYLLNDACVLLNIPLVSGSALKMEGQLTIYNYLNGPCYRCIFPVPPPPETVNNCGDAGVLGAVPGVIGVLQALETIKIIIGMENTLHSKFLLFDGSETKFVSVKLRNRNLNCQVCGTSPSITNLIDYEQFCGAPANDKDLNLNILDADQRMSASELFRHKQDGLPVLLLDVRSPEEFEMCSLADSYNIPLKELSSLKIVSDLEKKSKELESNTLVCCICRRGNDSQKAVQVLNSLLSNSSATVKDLRGGLHSWAASIDPNFPAY